jgi:diketogulonate reductase-like aldo/keto reductase
MQQTISDRTKLNNGTEIPFFGFGTYQIKGTSAKESVLTALEAGYRYIDTAAAYGNEKEVGEAVRESRLPRSEIFISTKLWNEDQGYNTAFEAFERSLDELGLSYIDLYLLHWPVTGMRLESWRALENIVKTDRCSAIGVCNFTVEHLGELLETANIIPAVNQVEFNPFLYQKELLDYCKAKDIRLCAYTPLSRGKKLDHPVLRDLSGKYHKTPAQILIRWAIEHELIVIPKSENKKRIFENADIFDFTITQIDMKKLDALNEGFRVAWDPSTIK